MAKKERYTCESALAPGSMWHCEGEQYLPGFLPRIYFIPKSHIVGWPKLPNSIGADEDMDVLASYKGNFKLAAGKFWQSIDVFADKSPGGVEVQGEKPSKTYLNRFTGVVSKVGKSEAGFSRVANNSDYVYLVQNKIGDFRVIGNEMYQTNTDCTLNTGASATDTDAGMSIEVTCTDVAHMPFYTGEILVADAEDANAPEVEVPEGE